MIKHVILIDKSSEKDIDFQNANIRSGSSVDQSLTANVKDLVFPLFEKRYCVLKKYYGDAFYSKELVRFKFMIEPVENPLELLEEAKVALIKKFKIKKLTYLEEEDGSSTMLLVWM
jgi:hypothetical protein